MNFKIGDIIQRTKSHLNKYPHLNKYLDPEKTYIVTSISSDLDNNCWLGFKCNYEGQPDISNGTKPNWGSGVFKKVGTSKLGLYLYG